MENRFDELNSLLRKKFNRIGVDYELEYKRRDKDDRFDVIRIKLKSKKNNRTVVQESFAGYYDYSRMQCESINDTASMLYAELMNEYGYELGVRKKK